MSKNTGTSELINYFDLGANGDVGIAGSLDVNTIANATTDTDKFLVSDTGIIKYRTGAELLSDIGAQGLLTNPVTGTGSAGQVTYWSSSSQITGTSNFLFNASERNLTIDRSLSTLGNAITISKGSDADQAWLAFKQGGGASGTWRLGYTGDPYDFRINVGSDSSIGTQALRIFLATQNVVIGTGTVDSGFKLDVAGTGRFTSSVTSAGLISSSTVRPSSNFAADLGTSSIRWADIFGFSLNVTGSVTSQVNNISADGAGVVLQGYVDNILRIAVRGSGYNSGARGGLLASTADFSSSVTAASLSLSGTIASGGDAATLTIKQAGTTFTNGIYLERAGERNGYYMYIGGGLDALTFRRNYFGTQSDVMSLTRDGNVGIGTNNPDNKLAVWGTNNGLDSSQGNINVYTNDTAAIDTGGSIGLGGYYTGTSQAIPFANITGKKENSTSSNAAGYLAFLTRNNSTGTGERMRITSDGNVLVGATNPDVGGSVKGACIRQNGSIVAATNISSPFHYQSPITADRMNTQGDGLMYGMWRQGIFQAGIGATNGSVMTFFTGNNSSMTERMRITSGGSLQINYNPGGGDIYFRDTTNGAVMFYIIPATYVGTAPFNSNRILAANSSHISFETGGSPRMTILSGGNVLIGTTSDNGNRLQVNGSSSFNGDINLLGASEINGAGRILMDAGAGNGFLFRVDNVALQALSISEQGVSTFRSTGGGTIAAINSSTSTTTLNVYSEMGVNTNNTSSFHFVGAQAGFGNRIQIFGNGNVTNSNGSYGAISDIKLKENITDATPKLDDLLKVKIRNYNLIGEDIKQLGVIAQELENIFPSMIDESQGIKSVKYSIFIPMIIKAIQELNEKINK